MKLQKFRWSKVYESPEEELIGFLQAKGISAKRVTVEEFHDFEGLNFDHDVTLYCAEGALIFTADDGVTTSLQPGDATHIDAYTVYQARAGLTGCAYYEVDRSR